jgi:hypothetical protein
LGLAHLYNGLRVLMSATATALAELQPLGRQSTGFIKEPPLPNATMPGLVDKADKPDIS